VGTALEKLRAVGSVEGSGHTRAPGVWAPGQDTDTALQPRAAAEGPPGGRSALRGVGPRLTPGPAARPAPAHPAAAGVRGLLGNPSGGAGPLRQPMAMGACPAPCGVIES